MGKKKRLKQIEERLLYIENFLRHSDITSVTKATVPYVMEEAPSGLSIKPALQGLGPRDSQGHHPDGGNHIISSIGRGANEAIYNCSCGAKLVFEGQKVMIGAEGGPGMSTKFDFNPFQPNMKKIPSNWELGEELKQLD